MPTKVKIVKNEQPQIRALNLTSIDIVGTVGIGSDGEATSSPSIIPLGVQGDHNAHGISVGISKLLIQGRNIENLIANYTAELIFRQGDKAIGSVATTAHVDMNLIFPISESVTTHKGDVSIIFVLREKSASGNVSNNKEVFTSSAFKGTFMPSLLDVYNAAETITLDLNNGILQKPAIRFGWKNNDLQLISQKMLGYSQDKFISEINIDKNRVIDETDNADYYILFKNLNNNNQFYKQKFVSRRTFLTEQVTAEPGKWELSIAVVKADQKKFSGILIMEVCDNTLQNEPIRTVDLADLKDSEKAALLAADNQVNKFYTLKFTGTEIDNLLTKIQAVASISNEEIDTILNS